MRARSGRRVRGEHPTPMYSFVIHSWGAWMFDIDLLDDHDPFEIDEQAAHLFKHAALGIADVIDLWQSDPVFYPATPPAHWLMVGAVAGRVLVVPLAPADSADPRRCRPIGCYLAATHLVERYLEDR